MLSYQESQAIKKSVSPSRACANHDNHDRLKPVKSHDNHDPIKQDHDCRKWAKIMRGWGWVEHHIWPAIKKVMQKVGKGRMIAWLEIAATKDFPGKYLRGILRYEVEGWDRPEGTARPETAPPQNESAASIEAADPAAAVHPAEPVVAKNAPTEISPLDQLRKAVSRSFREFGPIWDACQALGLSRDVARRLLGGVMTVDEALQVQ